VAVVPGVLGAQVEEQPTQRERLAAAHQRARLVQGGRGGDDLAGAVALRPPQSQGFLDVAVEGVEVLVGVVVGVVDHRYVLTGELLAEPPPLDTREVTEQAVQAES